MRRNILTENMRRFSTKNLAEQQHVTDSDSNNNGYPDSTENISAELTPDLIKEKIIEKIKSANTKQRSVSDDYDVAYFEGVMSGLEEILEDVFHMENVYFITKR